MHVTIAISHAHPVWKENHVFNNLSDLLFKHCKPKSRVNHDENLEQK